MYALDHDTRDEWYRQRGSGAIRTAGLNTLYWLVSIYEDDSVHET